MYHRYTTPPWETPLRLLMLLKYASASDWAIMLAHACWGDPNLIPEATHAAIERTAAAASKYKW